MERSEFLRQQAQQLRHEVTVAWIVHQVGASGSGWLLVCVAAPSLLPIPGVGNVSGAALMVLALWMVRGHWLHLPVRVATLTLGCAHAQRALRTLATVAAWSERHMRPRWPACAGRGMWAASAMPVGLMGLIIFLPLPLGNVLGAASVILFGLGYAMEDGWVVLLGWLASVGTVLYAAALVWGLQGLWTQVLASIGA